MPRGAKKGERRGGRVKGTPNRVNACTREQLVAEIERRVALVIQANPFVVGLDIMFESEDARLRLQAAEFIGDRLLPKIKAVEHTGDLQVDTILHVTLD